jgi:uncharacterized 2Fe-2S/4Fe-4S cluster protein (DUF4445 family)
MQKAPKVRLLMPGKDVTVECLDQESILEAMVREGIHYRNDCGGRGTCGKCRILLKEGKLESTVQDQKVLSVKEIEQGYRLSCKAYPSEDCTVLLVSEQETEFDIISENRMDQITSKVTNLASSKEYLIGVDLGTTTLAFAMMDALSRKIISTHTVVNSQRRYGSDVVSRIKASNEGKREQLRDTIQKDLLMGIKEITKIKGIDSHRITHIVISGNTTMIHLLLGYPCETLGVYPFTPVNIMQQDMLLHQLISFVPSCFENINVTIMPGISAFIGGDIVSGLLTCGFSNQKLPCLLIDLGTNGEIALGNKDRILVTSTAAGPAFEGGNISCGVGSVTGAISHIKIRDNRAEYETIGNKAPVGICGTGIIETVSELLKESIIDETGLLASDYFEEGFVLWDGAGEDEKKLVISQKDIRELQMAKAAVRAGIETLVNCYGITYGQVDKVYLAGGFGYRMDIEKAIHIGLLPEEFRGKIEAVGNSSLAGALQFPSVKTAEDEIDHILSVVEEIHLANEEEFSDLYLKYMYLK